MEKNIYLDNSATTPICESALCAMRSAVENFANPSSLHAPGLVAHKMLDNARAQILAGMGLVGDRNTRIIFTSGGTEANNLAIFGTINAKKFKFLPQIITSDSEHPSILEPLSYLESCGLAEIVKIPTVNGCLDLDLLSETVCDRTVLVSIMSANNETGALYDVASAFSVAKKINPQIITHTDAVQAFLKTNMNFRALKADLVSLSGHKVNAPKGVGALAVSGDIIKAKKLVPIIRGGGQEGDLRSGTENVVGISAFGAAVKYRKDNLSEFIRRTSELSELLISLLPQGIKVNRPEMHAPHIVSITLPSIKSETALHFLSERGIFVSSGSACASNGKHKSYVLRAFGLSELDIDCTLRISLSDIISREDIEYTARTLGEAVERLVKIG
ncbi:MAG: cysteine desulfurase [Clostridia bacterium]|nr:cysteine desulfurase [Clostridia bacterium]